MEQPSEFCNLREFTRVPVSVCLVLTSEDKTIKTESTRNISMNGVYVLTPELLPLDASCEVKICLGSWDSPYQIRARGMVVRVDTEGMGVQFIEILGMESFQHLQNLVISNSGNYTEKVEEEMAAHIGIRKLPEGKPPVKENG